MPTCASGRCPGYSTHRSCTVGITAAICGRATKTTAKTSWSGITCSARSSIRALIARLGTSASASTCRPVSCNSWPGRSKQTTPKRTSARRCFTGSGSALFLLQGFLEKIGGFLRRGQHALHQAFHFLPADRMDFLVLLFGFGKEFRILQRFIESLPQGRNPVRRHPRRRYEGPAQLAGDRDDLEHSAGGFVGREIDHRSEER